MNDEKTNPAPLRCPLGLGILVIGLIVVAGAIVTIGVVQGNSISFGNPLWVVGMLVAFGGALAVIAVVFRCLDLQSKDEAFALPPGSIRTLLAVGVMMLFAFFGVNFVGQPVAGVGEKLQPTAEVEASRLQKEIERLKAEGLTVVVESMGSASAPARLALYHSTSKRADSSDLQKQIVTALITLLTSVIGFYFGSRSAEGPRKDADKGGGTPPAGDDGLATLQTEAGAALERGKGLAARAVPPDRQSAVVPLKEQIDKQRQRLDDALQAAVKGKPGSAERSAAIGTLKAELAAFTQQLDALDNLLTKG